MKRYLITGASRGIGRAIAEQLAADGVELLLHGRDRAALDETRGVAERAGAAASVVVCDLRDPAGVEELAAYWGDRELHGLINNAGVAVVKPFAELSRDEWNTSLAINVTAPFLLTQRLAPKMPTGASIVNILSIAAKTGFPNWSSYCAAKFALEGLSQSIREELRPRGVRVINVYPSATDTGIWDSVAGDWPREKMIAADEVGRAVAFALSRPADVAIEKIEVLGVSGRL